MGYLSTIVILKKKKGIISIAKIHQLTFTPVINHTGVQINNQYTEFNTY